VCGLLFVVLLVISFVFGSTPDTNKSPQYILHWYNESSNKRALEISTIGADISVVLGLFWFGYLRDRFNRSDVGARLSPIMLAGAIIFATGGLIFSGANFALTDDPKKMLPATAQALNFIESDIGAGALTVGISIFMFAAGFIILKSRIVPVWMAWVSFVLAVVALAGPLGFFAFLATGLWILIMVVIMWRLEQTRPFLDDTFTSPENGSVSTGTPGTPGAVTSSPAGP
jgi:hypothetical protein